MLCSGSFVSIISNHAVEVRHLRQKYEDYVLDIASASANVKLAITEARRRYASLGRYIDERYQLRFFNISLVSEFARVTDNFLMALDV